MNNQSIATRHLRSRSQPPEPIRSVPDSSFSGSCSGRKVLPENNRAAILNHRSIQTKDICSVCFETFDLSKRVITLTACQHLFHKDCWNKWADKHESTIFKCPICQTPAVRNAPYWDEASKSFVVEIKETDLNRPEPFISQSMQFQRQNPGQSEPLIVNANLQLKGVPSISARSTGTKITSPENRYDMTLITDNHIHRLTMNKIGLGEAEEPARADKRIITKALILLINIVGRSENLKSLLIKKIFPIFDYPLPHSHAAVSGKVEQAEDESYIMTLSPGLPLRSITLWANITSFMLHVLTCREFKPWLFDNPEELHKYGNHLSIINFQKRAMDWLPPIPESTTDHRRDTTIKPNHPYTMGASDQELVNANSNRVPLVSNKTRCQDGSARRVGSPSVVPQSASWRALVKMDMKVSSSQDGQNPFASLKEITFKKKHPSGCIKDSYVMDPANTPDETFEQFKKDFSDGIQRLKNDRSFYVHIAMSTNQDDEISLDEDDELSFHRNNHSWREEDHKSGIDALKLMEIDHMFG